MYSYCISGDLSRNEIQVTLQQRFPSSIFQIFDVDPSNADQPSNNRNHAISESFEGTFMTTTPNIVDSLKYELELRDREILSLEEIYFKSMEDLKAINQQHDKLLQDFTLLRKKYDEKKHALLDILWNQCSRYHPELSSIPQLSDAMINESDNIIGKFVIGSTLGDGKYGVVKSCHDVDTGNDYAVKIIAKEKITSITALRRLSNEIEILKSFQNPCIISLEMTLQTKRNLYIVMEKGGPDLFELISRYPNGLPEKWAQNVMFSIVNAVKACHLQGICHRGKSVHSPAI
jgi:hypothetical protein